MDRKMAISGMVSVVAASLVSTGCGTLTPDYMVVASAEGLRAHGDTLNGLGDPQRGQAYYQGRMFRESEETERGKCNALAALFGKCQSAGTPRVTGVSEGGAS